MAVTRVVVVVFAICIAFEIAGVLLGSLSAREMLIDSAVPVLGAAAFLALLATEQWADLAPWALVLAMVIEPMIAPSSGPLLMFDAILPLTLLLLLLARRRTVRRLERELARGIVTHRTPAPQ